ncbi:MAG: AtpZ/AtpI family protein [Ignavibacteriales bacterium]|nr:AtpZ/AtpI family protein [Ignavibacteriales bacterium]
MDDPNAKKPSEGMGKTFRDAAPYLTLGIQLAITVIGFFFLGFWLDKKFDTTPWLSLAGFGVGCVGGFIKFLQSVKAMSSSEGDATVSKHRED